MLLSMRNNFIVRLVCAENYHRVDVGNVQHFGGLQAIQTELLDGDDKLDPFIIRDNNILALLSYTILAWFLVQMIAFILLINVAIFK